jgi:hypothetical protein
MTEKKLANSLTEIRKLLHDYQSLANQLAAHHNNDDIHHQLHGLMDRLNHLKAMVHDGNLTEEAKKKSFLEHHFQAIKHANQHMANMQLHAEHIFEAEELEIVRDEMMKLLAEIEEQEEWLGLDDHLDPF